MIARIRALLPADVDVIVDFSLRAWAPVSASFEGVLGREIYRRVYPDWLTSQAQAVRDSCADERAEVWVATVGEQPVGYVALIIDSDRRAAVIDMLAVDPNHQGQGVGTALVEHAVARAAAAGASVVSVATGGDAGHAPARRAYDKAGFTPLPLVRYYRAT